MRNTVKGFGEVYCHARRPGRGQIFIETLGRGDDQWQQSGDGGVVRFETVLGRLSRKGFSEVGKKEALKYLGTWAEEGDRTVGRAKCRRFTRFEERDDGRGFPNGRKVRILDGKVE